MMAQIWERRDKVWICDEKKQITVVRNGKVWMRYMREGGDREEEE